MSAHVLLNLLNPLDKIYHKKYVKKKKKKKKKKNLLSNKLQVS